MREAVRLSIEMMQEGRGGPFGAVIVKDSRIIARGYNQVTSTNDPTAHAEITAIRKACKDLKSFSLDGCELYASCEPCPMCIAAVYWARIGRIYYANTRRDAADIGFDDYLIHKELTLPVSERKLPMEQIMRDHAYIAFEQWKNKDDKIMY